MRLRISFSVMLFAAFAIAARPVLFTPSDATNALLLATALVKLHTPRHAGTAGARKAAEWILASAQNLGVNAKLDSFRAKAPGGELDFANVIGEIRGIEGASAPWIVFISHFDTYPNAGPGFEGANDGASTTGLLLALAKAVNRAGIPRCNVSFVWTDGEEARYSYGPDDGFQGAKRAVSEFKRLGRNIRAAVNLDMLGDSDLHIELPANATSALNEMVLRAADREGLSSFVSVGQYAVTDDYSAFLSEGWPSTDLIDFSFGPQNHWWHVPDDTLDKISVNSLWVSGRIAAAVFNILDQR